MGYRTARVISLVRLEFSPLNESGRQDLNLHDVLLPTQEASQLAHTLKLLPLSYAG